MRVAPGNPEFDDGYVRLRAIPEHTIRWITEIYDYSQKRKSDLLGTRALHYEDQARADGFFVWWLRTACSIMHERRHGRLPGTSAQSGRPLQVSARKYRASLRNGKRK